MAKRKKCHYNQKPCMQDECGKWGMILGSNPQTGEPVNKMGCTDEVTNLLLVEVCQKVSQLSASVESWRNEMVRLSMVPLQIGTEVENAKPKDYPQAISGFNEQNLKDVTRGS